MTAAAAAAASKMPRPRTFITIIFLIILFDTSLGQMETMEHGIKPAYNVDKMHKRKALLVDVTLDYDTGGANCKNDPKIGKPGNCGKNNP